MLPEQTGALLRGCSWLGPLQLHRLDSGRVECLLKGGASRPRLGLCRLCRAPTIWCTDICPALWALVVEPSSHPAREEHNPFARVTNSIMWVNGGTAKEATPATHSPEQAGKNILERGNKQDPTFRIPYSMIKSGLRARGRARRCACIPFSRAAANDAFSE